MSTRIKPTVGRVVYYKGEFAGEEHAAIIAHVYSDDCINLAVFNSQGEPYHRTSVKLVQDGEAPPEAGGYATWMPYQIGQAAKTEELQKQLDTPPVSEQMAV